MQQIIRKAKEGDAAAREALAAALRSRVRNACRRYACFIPYVERGDLEQEMWCGIFTALAEVDLTIGDPSQFLLQRGRFALLDSLKKRRHDPWEPELFEETPSGENVERQVVGAQAVAELRETVGARQQEIIGLLLQDFTRSEIARQMACTPANLTYHVNRIGAAWEGRSGAAKSKQSDAA